MKGRPNHERPFYTLKRLHRDEQIYSDFKYSIKSLISCGVNPRLKNLL